MALLHFIPPLLGAAAAALLWLAGRTDIAGLVEVAPEWMAITGLAVAVVAYALVSIRTTSRLSARLAEAAGGSMQIERLLAERMARLEVQGARLEAAEAKETHEAPKPAVARFAETLRTAPAAESRAEPAPQQENAESNVVKLDPASRPRQNQAKRDRQPMREIEQAVAAGRFEAWFQPVVSLPERKVRFLSGQPYLFPEGSAPFAPVAWLDTAGAAAGRPEIDRYMLLQAIKLRRDLARQEKPSGVIWSIGRQTLSDIPVWKEITQVLKANRALGGSIVCEITLADYSDLRQGELDALFGVREAGFQLGLRECNSLRALADAAKTGIFRFVSGEPGFIASATEIPELRSRDIAFIGTGVDKEEDAIGLIDRDVRLAQGPLFAPAKPLRKGSGQAKAPDGAA